MFCDHKRSSKILEGGFLQYPTEFCTVSLKELTSSKAIIYIYCNVFYTHNRISIPYEYISLHFQMEIVHSYFGKQRRFAVY